MKFSLKSFWDERILWQKCFKSDFRVQTVNASKTAWKVLIKLEVRITVMFHFVDVSKTWANLLYIAGRFYTLHAAFSFNTEKLKFENISQKSRCYLKNHWTNTRLVCTHFNAFSTLHPNIIMRILISKFLEKKKF